MIIDATTNNYKITTSKPFEYKTKIIRITPNNNSRLNAEVVGPLKYLSYFWRSLDLTLINCEIKLNFAWSKYCVISNIWRTPEVDGASPTDASKTTAALFQANNARLSLPVVTLSINDNIKFLTNVKQGFKRTSSWDK